MRDGFEDATPADSRGDPLASVRLVGEDAADPPVRQAAEVLGVGLGVLYVGQLRRGPVLAPAHAPVARVDEHLVDGSPLDVGPLGVAVGGGVLPGESLGVEAHAPTPAPDAVVRLDERGEVAPGVRAESTGRVRRVVGHANRRCLGSRYGRVYRAAGVAVALALVPLCIVSSHEDDPAPLARPYSPDCVEGLFPELRVLGVPRSPYAPSRKVFRMKWGRGPAQLC